MSNAILRRDGRSRNGLFSAIQGGNLKAGESFPVLEKDGEVATIEIDGAKVEVFLDDVEIIEEAGEVSEEEIESALGILIESPDFDVDWNALINAFQDEPDRCWNALEGDRELRDRLMRIIPPDGEPAAESTPEPIIEPEPIAEPAAESTPEPIIEPEPEPKTTATELRPGVSLQAVLEGNPDLLIRLKEAWKYSDRSLHDRCFPDSKPLVSDLPQLKKGKAKK